MRQAWASALGPLGVGSALAVDIGPLVKPGRERACDCVSFLLAKRMVDISPYMKLVGEFPERESGNVCVCLCGNDGLGNNSCILHTVGAFNICLS